MTMPKSTPFQRKGDFNPQTNKTNNYGLEVKKIKSIEGNELKYARFTGNTITDPSDSLSGAILGAITECSQQGYIPRILEVKDLSRKENRVGSYTTGGYKIGNTYYPSNTTVYNYKVNYPDMMVYFTCSKYLNAHKVSIKTEEVNPVLINDIVRDHRGGLLIVKSEAGPFKPGDIIINMGEKRVTNAGDLLLTQKKSLNSITYNIIRNRKIQSVKVPVHDARIQALKRSQKLVDDHCGLSDFYRDIPICNGKILIAPTTDNKEQASTESKSSTI
jgi:hypothetical protein